MDKVQHILQCCEDKEYLRLFELSKPYIDPLGRLSWDWTDKDVEKKYRRLTVHCHADRAGDGEAAGRAFEELRKARDEMLDAEKREIVLRRIIDHEQQRRMFGCHDGSGDVENLQEKLSEFESRKTLTTNMRKTEQKEMNASIVAQQKEKLKQARKLQELQDKRQKEEEARDRVESLKHSRVSVCRAEDDTLDGSSAVRKPVAKKRRPGMGLF